jgi:hypothetical protein
MKPHIAYLVGTVVLLLAVGIWAVMERYEIKQARAVFKIDRWTGNTWRYGNDSKWYEVKDKEVNPFAEFDTPAKQSYDPSEVGPAK